MNYSIKHITKAFELAGIPGEHAVNVTQYLDEAVRRTRLIQPDNLEDLFELFCFEENISERELKTKKRDHHLVELRIKFAKLAKERFPKATQEAIGRPLNRSHETVLYYFRIIKEREWLKEKMSQKL